ncbi:hypothetical protein BGZ97_004844 [Linnemannia gamsii]|uniref:F-box domain-containing protein n=1 Tax=Linnemannia gamsii TaxID=64522 RepID=A0A9P6UFL9_9FUNG|nr:hypothetical protein BGZ97_004844 [Linnemannia gamsii]
MDPLSRLPLECLQALLALLAREDHYGTLSAIVRTNKHLASAALPFLYNDPYRVFSAERRFKQEDDSDYDYIPDEYLANGHRLTRMLLRRLSIISTTRIHKSTTLAYGIPYPASAPNTYTTRFFSPSPLSPAFDYLSYIRHLHVNPLAINLGQRFRRSRRVKAFVQDDEEFRQMCTSVLQGTESWSHATDMERIRYRRPREDPILISVFQVMFLRETTWTLAEPILEQLRSLTIPVSDVVRYRRVGVIGGRLRRLEKVRFMMDDEVCNFYAPRRSTSVSNEMVKTRRAAKMEAIVQFVKEYVQVFGSRQLREVEFVDGDEKGVGLWPDCSVYTFPTETQLEVTRLLEPLFLYQPPKLLDHKNWVNLAAHPEVSDLSKVKEVLCVEDEDERSSWRIFLGDNHDLLRNCRSLEEIKMFAIATSSFYWAVQEKRDMDKSSQLAVLEGKEEPTQDSGQGLVPLSRAIIFGSQAQMIPEVNNIAFAFSQTLTCLRAMEHSPSPEVLATETPRTTVGFSHFGVGTQNSSASDPGPLVALSERRIRAPCGQCRGISM